MKYTPLFLGLIILSLVSCTETFETKLEAIPIGGMANCDSNLVKAVKAIENDTFQIFDTSSYSRHLIKCEDVAHTNCFNEKYIFVSTYHETLFCLENWKQEGIDSIFTKQELEEYSTQEFDIPTKCYPNYTFVEKDSAESWISRNSPAPDGLLWIYSFSKPLVSKNNKYMLIEMVASCGRNCGGFMTFIIERGKDEWFVNRTIIHGVF